MHLKRVARERAKLAYTDDPGMAPTVAALALEWTRHRVKGGLILPRTGRYQRGELKRFRAAHRVDRHDAGRSAGVRPLVGSDR